MSIIFAVILINYHDASMPIESEYYYFHPNIFHHHHIYANNTNVHHSHQVVKKADSNNRLQRKYLHNHFLEYNNKISIFFNRLRKRPANRRLFFSFNQLLLSLVAPRLMRYQFDMMISSVLSELFRKIFVPAFTGSVKNVGSNEGSIFSSLHNLLRNNRVQQQQQPQQLQANLMPTPTLQTNVDLQKLLDNAQKLITLQAMIRNGDQSNSIDESKKSINADSHKEFNTSSMKKKKKTSTSTSTNKQSFKSDNKNAHRHQSNSKKDEKLPNSNNPTSMINNLSNGHSAVSTNDFIDFIRNNWKSNHATNSQNLNSSNNDDHQKISGIEPSTSNGKSVKNNIFKDFNINHLVAKSPSLDMGHHPSIDIGSGDDSSRPNFSSNIISKLKNSHSSSSSSSNAAKTIDSKKKFQIFKKKAKIEDFKMSHLTFIDTEVPNYGNQLLIKDPDKDGDDDSVESSHPFSSSMTMRNHYLKSKPSSSLLPNDHDLERANRWNNVLSSI